MTMSVKDKVKAETDEEAITVLFLKKVGSPFQVPEDTGPGSLWNFFIPGSISSLQLQEKRVAQILVGPELRRSPEIW